MAYEVAVVGGGIGGLPRRPWRLTRWQRPRRTPEVVVTAVAEARCLLRPSRRCRSRPRPKRTRRRIREPPGSCRRHQRARRAIRREPTARSGNSSTRRRRSRRAGEQRIDGTQPELGSQRRDRGERHQLLVEILGVRRRTRRRRRTRPGCDVGAPAGPRRGSVESVAARSSSGHSSSSIQPAASSPSVALAEPPAASSAVPGRGCRATGAVDATGGVVATDRLRGTAAHAGDARLERLQ